MAARTLLNVACHDMHQSSIRDAGGIAAFVKLLGEDPEVCKGNKGNCLSDYI